MFLKVLLRVLLEFKFFCLDINKIVTIKLTKINEKISNKMEKEFTVYEKKFETIKKPLEDF